MVIPARALLGLLIAGTVLPGCAIVPDACPSTFDEARSVDFDAGVDDPFIATGTVVRFVASPDPSSRGYDVNIARHDGPVFVPGVAFVRLAEPMAGIQDGDAVLVLGDRVRGHGRGPARTMSGTPANRRRRSAGRWLNHAASRLEISLRMEALAGVSAAGAHFHARHPPATGTATR